MSTYNFFLMLMSLIVGICAISGFVLAICHWRIIAALLHGIFLNNFGVWSSALVVTILIGFAWSAWASRRIHRSGKV